MRILFALSSPEYLRYYDTTMAELVRRGHDVAVGVNWLKEKKHARLDALMPDPAVRVVGHLPSREDVWVRFARAVRGAFDFVRYLHPRLAEAGALRVRALRKASPRVARLLNVFQVLQPPALERVYSVLRAAERAVPISARLVTFLRDERPDLVVVSPLVDLMSVQVDVVRASHALGIPVALPVASWDNLTNKGHLRVLPDAVMVWNDIQKEEAVALHGVPPERITTTGAQLFDRWFERTPSQTRESFCAMVGLPTDRPIILYTGSSIFIARSEYEVPYVERWIEAVRTSGHPALEHASILVRPHPFNGAAWETADVSRWRDVAIWPRGRYTPAAESSRDTFFDSLFYSEAIVGINTSAMIEAAILERPVLSLLTPDFAGTQAGTVHFRYLLPENGGFLRVAGSFAEHVDQLVSVMRAPQETAAQLRGFVDTFIRPHGRSRASTPLLADALERAATLQVPVEQESARTRVLRALLLPCVVVASWFLRPVDAEGRLGKAWWEGSRRERLVKQLVRRPLREQYGRVAKLVRKLSPSPPGPDGPA